MTGCADSLVVTTLVNNSPKYDTYLKGCFGMSFWVEVRAGDVSRRILFDVGPLAEPLFYNARLLGIDVAQVDTIVLSHAHFDHTAALADVLQVIGRPVPIFAHPDLFRTNFVLTPEYMNYGMVGRNRRESIESIGGHLILTRSPLELLPGVMLTGEVERANAFEESGGVSSYILDGDGRLLPDDLRDDMSLVVNIEGHGLVILTGCAHAGPINIARHAQKLFGVERICGLLGGFHLLEAPVERVERTIAALKQLGPEWIAPTHCTGLIPSAMLAMAMPQRYRENNAGDVVRVP